MTALARRVATSDGLRPHASVAFDVTRPLLRGQRGAAAVYANAGAVVSSRDAAAAERAEERARDENRPWKVPGWADPNARPFCTVLPPIVPIEMNCDKPDLTIAPPLPQYAFGMLVYGVPGKGKTTLAINLLSRPEFFQERFNEIYLVTPSADTLPEEIFGDIPAAQRFSEYSVPILTSIGKKLRERNAYTLRYGKRALLFFDDQVNMLRNQDPQLIQYFTNRRHKCGKDGSLSVLVTSQLFMKVPASIRRVLTHACVYMPSDEIELENIRLELGGGIPEERFYDVCRRAWIEEHDFLYIDVYGRKYYRNFGELLLDAKAEGLSLLDGLGRGGGVLLEKRPREEEETTTQQASVQPPSAHAAPSSAKDDDDEEERRRKRARGGGR